MKIGFLGTPDISAYVLQELYNAGYEIPWVVTQPDRKAGRGKKLTPPPVKVKAQELGLKVFQTDKFNKAFFEQLCDYSSIDLGVVIAFGMYLPTYLLEYPVNNCLNIHFSLLPKYRGAAPVARAIMDGEEYSGVTIMEIVKEMDAGDIVLQEKIKIQNSDTTQSLTWKLVEEGTKLLLRAIPDYVAKTANIIPQLQIGTPCYAHKLSKQEGEIDWRMKSISIHNKIRALYPWPGVSTRLESTKIKIIQAKAVEFQQSSGFENSIPGEIILVERKKGYILVKTGDTALLVEKVQPFGKREMDISEFVNGYKIEKGMRFDYV